MKLMVQLESLLNQKDDLSGSLQIKVRIFAHAVHTNNASVSTNSSMLLLDKIKYEYQHNGSVKTDEATVFFIKGVHGMVRHTAIKLLIKNGIEVCNTTARIKSKKDVSFLNEGTHPLGLCLDENHKNFKKKVDLSYFSSIKKQCIVNQVFWMIGPQHASLIKYHIPPILGNRVQETARMPITIQAKGISRMNNHHNKSMKTLIA